MDFILKIFNIIPEEHVDDETVAEAVALLGVEALLKQQKKDGGVKNKTKKVYIKRSKKVTRSKNRKYKNKTKKTFRMKKKKKSRKRNKK